MSKKLTKKIGSGVEYIDALTNSEIQQAQSFLETLKHDMKDFEDGNLKNYDPKSIDYKYQIGKFLYEELKKYSISRRERLYAFKELQDLTQNNIEACADRGVNRLIFEYYYRIYNYGYDLAISFKWSQWVDILDRSAATKDIRFLYWLKNKIKNLKVDELRLLLVMLTNYLKDIDTEVFDDDEINNEYDKLLTIMLSFNTLLSKYFEGDKTKLTKARREHYQKYRTKFINETLKEIKFVCIEEIPNICEEVFRRLFVDLDRAKNK